MSEIEVTPSHEYPHRKMGCALVGGTFTQTPALFEVDEIPAYLPNGEGEHLFVHIRKQGLTTNEVCEHWQKALSIHSRDVGTAGLKDRNGTATQWLSFRGITPAQIEDNPLAGVEVLACTLHRNKLKTGHLLGNRFSLRLALDDDELARGQALCETLAARGMPNYYGKQRFGRDGRNRRDGHLLLRNAIEGKAGGPKGFRRRFLISSYQSALFNDLLAQRIEADLLDTALLGDIMAKHDSGGQFVCEDIALEQPRMDTLAISPTGWMPGYRAAMAQGIPGEWEAALLAKEGLTAEDFRALGKIAIGTRRPLRVPVGDIALSQHQEGHSLLTFSLPPGAYASMLLHALGIEFM